MKENVPSYKDESTKVTDNQSTEVNILFMFNAVSRRLNSVNNLHNIRINRNYLYFFWHKYIIYLIL